MTSNKRQYITLNATIKVVINDLTDEQAVQVLDDALVEMERATRNGLENRVSIDCDLRDHQIER